MERPAHPKADKSIVTTNLIGAQHSTAHRIQTLGVGGRGAIAADPIHIIIPDRELTIDEPGILLRDTTPIRTIDIVPAMLEPNAEPSCATGQQISADYELLHVIVEAA